MSNYILMHSNEALFTGKKRSELYLNNVKDLKTKVFTEVSSIGLTGESKIIHYFKEDEIFHCFDGDNMFNAVSENDIDRQVKSAFRKGFWGNNKEFNRLKIENNLYHSAEGQKWKNHKYIKIENGRYIYPEDLKKQDATSYYSRPSNSRVTNAGGTFTSVKFKTTKSKENRSSDLEKAMLAINTKYKGTTNCSGCTAALDYLIRNKDRNIKVDVPQFDPVQSKQIADLYKTKDGKTPEFTYTGLTDKNDYFNGDPNFYRYYDGRKTANKCIEEILKQGDGARGHMYISFLGEYGNGMYSVYGGHDVLYAVKDGQVYIFDAQSNESFKAEDFFNKKVGRGTNANEPIYRHVNGYLRTDNLDVNYKNEFYKDKLQVGPEKAREHNIVRQKVNKEPREKVEDFMKNLSFKKVKNTVKNLGRSFLNKLFGRK